MARNLITLALVFLLFSGCNRLPAQRWEGFVYPNKDDLTVHIGIGGYESLEACRQSAIDALVVVRQIQTSGRISFNEAFGMLPETDYECGLNCDSVSGFSGRVCEETVR